MNCDNVTAGKDVDVSVLDTNGFVLGVTGSGCLGATGCGCLGVTGSGCKDGCLTLLASLTGSFGNVGRLGNSLIGVLLALEGCSNLLGLCGLLGGRGLLSKGSVLGLETTFSSNWVWNTLLKSSSSGLNFSVVVVTG